MPYFCKCIFNSGSNPFILRKYDWFSELGTSLNIIRCTNGWSISELCHGICQYLLRQYISVEANLKRNRGFGFFTIFQSAINYLVDTFQKYGASAIAANTFLRSVFAGAFPLFIPPMYHKLGIPWASSVFGFFSICLIPIPFIFYLYGPKIRARGKYSAVFS